MLTGSDDDDVHTGDDDRGGDSNEVVEADGEDVSNKLTDLSVDN